MERVDLDTTTTMTSPGPEEEDLQRLSDEERADDLVRSHHKPARSTAKQQQTKSSTGDNVRLQRMSDALDKFLDLIDHQATWVPSFILPVYDGSAAF